MIAARRVAVNTAVLYGRMLITIGITLYSTRLVLSALGSVDYGIFNLVAGVILLLSFLNTAMATSTQRFLSFHQGRKDLDMQKSVFTNSLILHAFIGIAIVLILQILGLFLFDGFLNIPSNRISEAKTIFSFMSVTVFFTIISVPYTGSLVANENMPWVALVNIVETLLKLGIAILLLNYHGDRLIFYGILTTLVSIVSFFINASYCTYRYKECRVKSLLVIDKGLMKELGSFAGWNLFGALCGVAQSQGLGIILNLFFGTIANTAYGIANQASSQLKFFSVTMLRALNPQIMKSEGAKDRPRMLRISMMASKFGFFLLVIFAIPCILEMESLLKFWLKNVPPNAVVFCQLILVVTMLNQLTIGLQSALQAIGRVKLYQSLVGTVLLLNLPLAYLLLYLGFKPYYILISSALIECVGCTLRIYLVKYLAGMSIREYMSRVFAKLLLPLLFSFLSAYLVVETIDISLRFLITVPFSIIVTVITIYFYGLCEDEKKLVNDMFGNIIQKISFAKTFTNP